MIAYIVVVLDQRDAFGSGREGDARGIRVGPRILPFRFGQVDLHCRPVANFRIDLQVALRLFDETVNHAEAEAAALAHGLRGEKGFERLLYNLARHSRSEEHTSELQSLMRISYAVFCLKKKNQN